MPRPRHLALALAVLLPSAIPARGDEAARQRVREPIVDVHVHTAPEHYELLLDLLASTGITRFVNLSGGQAGNGLEEALDAAAPFDGRVAVCANIGWRSIDEPDFAARQVALLEEAKALGARCLKIQKSLGLGVPDPKDPEKFLAVDDPILDPIWAAAGRLGLPIFIHTGDPKAFFEPLGPDNERMDELGVHPEWSFADPAYPRREALLAARDRVVARHRARPSSGSTSATTPRMSTTWRGSWRRTPTSTSTSRRGCRRSGGTIRRRCARSSSASPIGSCSGRIWASTAAGSCSARWGAIGRG
ncbi:MAG: amidohydrolase family protein [Myxococcales bacterium]|nr:amidohydrolase family protein [Myxococcales bacterium]